MQNLLLKDTYVFNLLKLDIVLDQYILNFSQRKDCNITVVDGSPALTFIDLYIYMYYHRIKTNWKHLYHEDLYRRKTLLEIVNLKIPEGDTNISKLVLGMKNLQENDPVQL